ncbi:MAG: glycosyltransferase [Actinomycetota bacterium]
MSDAPALSWIILTMGDRPDEVTRAVESIRRQSVAAHEILVVGNGADPGVIEGARCVTLKDNVGISAGRNEGADLTSGDVLCFLDDDAECASDVVANLTADLLRDRHDIAAVSWRITDAETGETQRRHVPRLRAADPTRSGDVTTFLGGACAIRRTDFAAAGGYPDEFFYAMEETDLAWRLLDAGRSIHYLSEAEVHHPASVPARHGMAFELTARNRVWLAHRRLPRALTVLYLAVWITLMLVRAPSMAARRDTLRGLRRGVRQRTPRPIDRMSWRTVATMTRLGRPPII